MALATAIFRHRRALIFAALASLLVFLVEIFYLSGVRTFSTGPLLGTLVLLPPLVLWYAMLGLWYAAWFGEGVQAPPRIVRLLVFGGFALGSSLIWLNMLVTTVSVR